MTGRECRARFRFQSQSLAMNLMTYSIRMTAILLVCLPLCDLHAFEESRVRFQESKGGAMLHDRRPAVLFHACERELIDGLFDPAAETLLAAAETFTKSVFSAPSLRFTKAITRRDAGDILVAEWNIDEPNAKGSLILKDTSVISLYELHLLSGNINSRDELTTFLSKLLMWSKPPVDTGSITIALPANTSGVGEFSGTFTTPPVSTPVIRDVYMAGVKDGKEWYMTLQVGKDFTESYYPVPPFVPERFPPLNELIQSWSFGRIWSEVGKRFDLQVYMDFSEYRDVILITELARRGLSEEQVVELLTNTEGSNLHTRARVVLDALRRSGKEASVNRYFDPALEMYEKIGPSAHAAVDTLFHNAARTCTPKVEAHALRLLKSGIFQEAALLYIGACSTSQETMGAIETLSVPDNLVQPKESVLQGIRRRAAHD